MRNVCSVSSRQKCSSRKFCHDTPLRQCRVHTQHKCVCLCGACMGWAVGFSLSFYLSVVDLRDGSYSIRLMSFHFFSTPSATIVVIRFFLPICTVCLDWYCVELLYAIGALYSFCKFVGHTPNNTRLTGFTIKVIHSGGMQLDTIALSGVQGTDREIATAWGMLVWVIGLGKFFVKKICQQCILVFSHVTRLI